jgi:peptidoglycan/xylan/chitin deacetylase (PgdA/CDA1 family)
MSAAASVFLMYHELELPNRRFCQSEPGYVRYVISEQEFREQMGAVRAAGLQGLNVTDALKFSTPAVAITVDDGCETDLLATAPILRQFGFGGTFYVVAGFLDKPGYLSVSQLRELSGLGFEIGCHSMTHPYLSDLDDSSLLHEITDSKNVLEQVLGQSVRHFSCPGGRYDSRAIGVAKNAGYHSFGTSTPRANSASTDRFSLGRVAITRGLNQSAFGNLCRGNGLWKFGLRVGIRDSAKRVLGNSAYDRVRAILLRR